MGFEFFKKKEVKAAAIAAAGIGAVHAVGEMTDKNVRELAQNSPAATEAAMPASQEALAGMKSADAPEAITVNRPEAIVTEGMLNGESEDRVPGETGASISLGDTEGVSIDMPQR